MSMRSLPLSRLVSPLIYSKALQPGSCLHNVYSCVAISFISQLSKGSITLHCYLTSMHNSLRHPIRISLPGPHRRHPLNKEVRLQDKLNEQLVDRITKQYFKRLVNWRVSAELQSALNDSDQKHTKPPRQFRASKAPVSLLRSKLKNKQNAGRLRQRKDRSEGRANSTLKQTTNSASLVSRTRRRSSYEESWDRDSRSLKQQSRPFTSMPNSPSGTSASRFNLTLPKTPIRDQLSMTINVPLARRLRRLFRSPSMPPSQGEMMVIGVSSPLS